MVKMTFRTGMKLKLITVALVLTISLVTADIPLDPNFPYEEDWVKDKCGDKNVVLNGIGTPEDDCIIGNEGGLLLGNGGNDVIIAGNGEYIIIAGDGNDLIYGSSGGDEIYALGGDDIVHAGTGDDWIEGGSGDDKILAEQGDDYIDGGDGDDEMYGQNGGDHLVGGPGKDKFIGGPGSNTAIAEPTEIVVEHPAGETYVILEGITAIEKAVNQIKQEIVVIVNTTAEGVAEVLDLGDRVEALETKAITTDKNMTELQDGLSKIKSNKAMFQQVEYKLVHEPLGTTLYPEPGAKYMFCSVTEIGIDSTDYVCQTYPIANSTDWHAYAYFGTIYEGCTITCVSVF